ncbi:MAG: glycosyltransferase family 2 protein [candidate division NC10 bacterium]|nr:glycosyltransferase family 2 protein [candidate division NC10 bacterium]
MSEAKEIAVSVVIPLFNEAENVSLLYSELKGVLESLDQEYEIILVDDGSRDATPQLMEELQGKDQRIVAIFLRRNFGQTAALSAGFDQARGKVIITLDGDLQNDPADIPQLLQKSKEYDVVSGWRVHRQDPFFSRRLPSMVANWIISKVTGVHLHDYGCTLKAYRREVIRGIRLYGEMHRFIPAIASWMGTSIVEVPTHHRPRRFGRSKYGMSRIIRVLLDLIAVKFLISFSTKPIQFFGTLGALSILGGIGISLYLTSLKFLFGLDIGRRPLLLLGVLLIILGVQLVAMGLLGELLVRVYHESQAKPIYVVRKILGRPDAA